MLRRISSMLQFQQVSNVLHPANGPRTSARPEAYCLQLTQVLQIQLRAYGLVCWQSCDSGISESCQQRCKGGSCNHNTLPVHHGLLTSREGSRVHTFSTRAIPQLLHSPLQICYPCEYFPNPIRLSESPCNHSRRVGRRKDHSHYCARPRDTCGQGCRV